RHRLRRRHPHLADQARARRTCRLAAARTRAAARDLPVHRHRHRPRRGLHPAFRRRRAHRHRRTDPGEPRFMSSTSPELQPILVDGAWRQARSPEGRFNAYNPSTRETIAEHAYPVSGWQDLDDMLEAGRAAAEAMARLPAQAIADFLERYADGIEARAEALIESAHRETGLPVEPRLRNAELPRTTGQLRQAAKAARDGGWRRPTIDTAANIRSIHAPLGGPVVVFGPNNFPYAFNGISGGDFAAAIAAGNPVIAKAHPAHPRTSVLLAEIGRA